MTRVEDLKNNWDESASEQGKYLMEELSLVGVAWESLLREQLSGKKSGKILDIGCGTGFLSILLAKLGFEVTAIDISAGMLKEAKRIAEHHGVGEKICFIEQDAATIKFPPESFDAVVSRHASWLFKEPEKIYERCFEILTPGGVMLNFDANWLLPVYNAETRLRFEEDEKALIAKCGAFEDYYHHTEIINMLLQLPLAQEDRPHWDWRICEDIGFIHTKVIAALSESLFHPFFAMRYRQIPTFLIRAQKS